MWWTRVTSSGDSYSFWLCYLSVWNCLWKEQLKLSVWPNTTEHISDNLQNTRPNYRNSLPPENVGLHHLSILCKSIFTTLSFVQISFEHRNPEAFGRTDVLSHSRKDMRQKYWSKQWSLSCSQLKVFAHSLLVLWDRKWGLSSMPNHFLSLSWTAEPVERPILLYQRDAFSRQVIPSIAKVSCTVHQGRGFFLRAGRLEIIFKPWQTKHKKILTENLAFGEEQKWQ